MHITARADCAVRALAELAREGGAPLKADALAKAADLAPKFLEAVLADLRHGGLVCSRRGPDGGYWLARPASEISIADVIRTAEGPLASVRGERPEDVTYSGAAVPLQQVWIAVRVNLRSVLEQVSVADVANDSLPAFVTDLTADPGAWRRREPEGE
ncbi:Rrf2 family transcriptional regulator [Aldersonia sp. NBC_00410]|uniref:RrF2 family transcriptional regulator n=1 Tax=Aldersonia sp. NBC_00410 TaxID=2975954 RepID=UPI002253B65C|nr:Rrf2 family transcriptional regulator [Aldersonia sp. NBC_00410]MCX5042121.1 Rrf2 family transcriptional regulator [Aldersonia sp. NBC_00410]